MNALTLFRSVVKFVSISSDPDQWVLVRSSMTVYKMLPSHSSFGVDADFYHLLNLLLDYQEHDWRYLWLPAPLGVEVAQLRQNLPTPHGT